MKQLLLCAAVLLLFATARAQDATAEAKPAGEIAMTICQGDNCRIGVMSTDGNHLRYITPADQIAYAPQWSPDGQKLVYVIETSENHSVLMACDADGSNPVQLGGENVFNLYTSAHFSQDGKRFVYGDFGHNKVAEFYTIRLDGKERQKLDLEPVLTSVNFLPDGTLFIVGSDGVFQAQADGSHKILISSRFPFPGVLSPNQQRLVVWDASVSSFVISTPDGQNAILALPARINSDWRAGFGPGELGWSPDGNWVSGAVRVFPVITKQDPTPSPMGYAEPENKVFTARADGREYHIIPADDTVLTWSPDSQYIAYAVKIGRSEYQIFIAHPDGSGAVQLTSGDNHSQPAWRPV
jgi:Tol biopolymer transport system component